MLLELPSGLVKLFVLYHQSPGFSLASAAILDIHTLFLFLPFPLGDGQL